MLSVYGRRHAFVCRFMSQSTNIYLKIPIALKKVVRTLLRLSGRATFNCPLMQLCFVATSCRHFTSLSMMLWQALHFWRRCVRLSGHMCVILRGCMCVYMLCKYEPRYGYMSACILISIDFSNSLIVAQFGFWFFCYNPIPILPNFIYL